EDGGAGATASASVSLDISVSSSTVVPGPGLTLAAVEGISTGDQAVATFTAPGQDTNVADFSADIDWGDGSGAEAGTITLDPSTGVFTVHGSHTYAEEGTQTLTVTIHHQTAASATVMSTANVADAALTAQGTSLTTEEGVAVNGVVATFTDANPNGTVGD